MQDVFESNLRVICEVFVFNLIWRIKVISGRGRRSKVEMNTQRIHPLRIHRVPRQKGARERERERDEGKEREEADEPRRQSKREREDGRGWYRFVEMKVMVSKKDPRKRKRERERERGSGREERLYSGRERLGEKRWELT